MSKFVRIVFEEGIDEPMKALEDVEFSDYPYERFE